MNKTKFIDCEIGDNLPADAFSSPDGGQGHPCLIVWQPFGAKLAVDCTWFTFERAAKGTPWVRTH